VQAYKMNNDAQSYLNSKLDNASSNGVINSEKSPKNSKQYAKNPNS